MSTIFLGMPPASIEAWIKGHRPTPPTPPTSGPLCFTAEEDGSSVSLVGWDGDMWEQIDIWASLQYSTDGNTWHEWDGHIISLNNGEKVYVKALNPNPDGMSSNYGMQSHKFVLEGKVAASGNIQYLLEETGSRTVVPEHCYYGLFQGCTSLTQAPALPATTLTESCYSGMFMECTSLTQAPELPATTLDDNCYYNMFWGCTSLTQAPALPATTLAYGCYWGMFQGCSSLKSALDLPAESLAESCYQDMFNGCTSLTQAPALPATTLANYCYQNMFNGCTSLTQAPALPATTLADTCYWGMFQDCTNVTEVQMKNAVNPYDSKTYGYLNKGGSYPNYTELINITYVD